jgi:hypothetical protein
MLKPLNNEDLAKEDSKNKIIVTYDIESTQIRVDDKTSRHEPNLLISGKYIKIPRFSNSILYLL